MVIRVPVRQAKGEAMAITEGREYRSKSATWGRGTRLERISRAISKSWFTKKTKKKKRKHTKNAKKISRVI
jgi:hypothetical protein